MAHPEVEHRERDMMRRFTYCVVAVTIGVLSLASGLRAAGADSPASAGNAKDIVVYIGTYTAPKSHGQGIYVSHLNPESGALSQPELAAEMPNPSYVAISPDHRFLYAAGEYGYKDDRSAVGAFAIKPDGKLTPINQQSTDGNSTCYLIVDQTGKNVLISSYSNGYVAILRTADDGSLLAPGSIDQHHAPTEDQHPRAHCVDPDPSNHFALCCDLGLDRLYVYRFDPMAGSLTANDPPFAQLAPKTGPRHLVYSPDGKFVYSIDELASSVTAFSWDGEHGVLHEIQTISTLPKGFTGQNLSCAELEMHPSGKFLYGSNRGHDSIVEFSVDRSTGMLSLAGHTSTQGKTPRGFGIDPTGRWLIAGNQNSDSLVEFSIDQETGALKSTGTKFDLRAPVCVKFMETRQ
jgi:6-phosphogluconolactonase